MQRNGITPKESQIIKGISILLMLFYHLLGNQQRLDDFQVTGLLPGMPIITAACHCCVTLFVFVTAYGLTVQEQDEPFRWKAYFAKTIGRYRKLVVDLCYVFTVLVLISQVFSLKYNVVTVWGDSLVDCIKGSIATVLGLAGLFKIPWFSPTWWYMKLAVLFLFLVPVLERIIRRLPAILALTITLVVVPLAGFSTTRDCWPRYIIVVILGILTAQRNWIGRLWGYFAQKPCRRMLFMVILACLIPVTAVTRYFVNQNYLMDAVMTLWIVVLAIFGSRLVPRVNRPLECLGLNSMYMWWVHPFFLNHWWSKFTYSFKNIWAIFVVLVVINLFVAIVLTKIKRFVLNLVPETMKKYTGSPWLWAFLSVAVCVIITASTSSMGYLTNDDGGIQALLSGNVTGEPYITHQFINILLGIFISTLYKIFPGVQWWYWYSLGIFLIGMYVIHLCFFKQGKQKGLKVVVPLIFVAVMDLVFLAYAMANIAFTIVPAVLGSGLVAAWMIEKPILGRKRKIAAAAVTVLVYMMVLMHRRDTGIVLLCYILLAILYYMTKTSHTLLKLAGKFAAVSVFFIALSAALLMGNNFALTQINGKDFIEYNSARADYMDYPKQTYEENPELYHEVGWDEDVAALVRKWCFVDENVTTESFQHLAGTKQSVSTNIKESIADFINDDKCPPMLLLGGMSAVAAGICLVWRFDKRFLFFFLANNGGTLVLLAYQIFVGRILYRSAIVVLLPCFVINTLFVLEHFALGGKTKKFFTFAGAMLTLVLVVSSQFFVFDPARNVDKENAWAASRQVESYAIDHSDLTYICTIGVYNIVDPWTVYPEEKPTNLLPWGNSSYGSDSYKKRLQINGLTELSADTFLMDQVRFMFTDNVIAQEDIGTNGSFFHLFRYLKNRTNMVGFVLEEEVSNSVYVYRFISSENKEDYDSYYIVTDTGKLQLCV